MRFSHAFLRIYDRKIASGEITFSRSGIDKNDFTRLCIDPDYVISQEALELVCDRMHLDQEERDLLYRLADYD